VVYRCVEEIEKPLRVLKEIVYGMTVHAMDLELRGREAV
jgi:hypothetical protein